MSNIYNGNYLEQYYKQMEESAKQAQFSVDKIIADSSTATILDKIKAQGNLNSAKSGASSINITNPSISNGNFVQKANPYMQFAGSILGAVNSWIPEKSTAEGAKGNVYTTANNIYSKISDAALSSGNPYAMAAGVAMKAGSALNKGLSSITKGATSNDGMTTVDSLLASDFLWADPISLTANLAGKKSHKLYTNDDTWASAGASYAGSKSNYDEASTKANKKYSLFSTSARHKANDQIDEANQQLFKLTDIMDKARDQFDIRTAMSYLNSLRYGNLIRGGYQQDTSTAIGKNGMKIKSLKNNIKLIRQGSQVSRKTDSKETYSKWIQGIPKDFINPNYDLEGAFNAFPIEKLERWKYAINHLDLPSDNPASINYKDEKGNTPNHLPSIVELPNGDYMFLKKFTETLNPEVFYETRTYYDGSNGLKETHDLIFDGDRYYYRRKTIPKHESGGSIQKPINGSIISITNPTTIEDIEEFKDGGSINVIPDGALHARLHHMDDADGLTKKGIPVVDNDGEQQAEVEREELIFRLEVTKKLEELEKKYYQGETSQKEKDDLALEAGKLLTEEILHNTQDNTNNLL